MTGKAGNRIQVYGIQYAGLGARTQDQDQMSTLEQKQDTRPGIRPEHRTSFWTKTQDQKARQDTRNRTEQNPWLGGKTRIENQSGHWPGSRNWHWTHSRTSYPGPEPSTQDL